MPPLARSNDQACCFFEGLLVLGRHRRQSGSSASTVWPIAVTCTADAKTLPGISAPFENMFDPANLIGRADGSVRPVQEIKRWREAEITHSRVAMLAALGFVIGEQLEVGVLHMSLPRTVYPRAGACFQGAPGLRSCAQRLCGVVKYKTVLHFVPCQGDVRCCPCRASPPS